MGLAAAFRNRERAEEILVVLLMVKCRGGA
jgi:hypothetical protein